MRQKKRLGEILVDAGLLSEDQLKKALAEHKKVNLKLGQYLVRHSLLSEHQIMDQVSRQLDIDKYDPRKYPLDLTVASLIPADMAKQNQVAPLKKRGDLLTIAMIDPLDINALDSVEAHANCEVAPVICTEKELNQLIDNLYGSYTDLGETMEDIGSLEIYRQEEETGAGQAEDLAVSSLQGEAEKAPVIRLVNSILSQAIRDGASDIHITPEKNYIFLQFRVDGKLRDVPAPPKSMFLAIASRLKIMANLDIATSRVPQDGRFTVKMEHREINIRVSTMPTVQGENIVLRLLDMSVGIYSLEKLGMAEADVERIRAQIGKPYGLILSTGPTGSGKSTSLYSILKEIQSPEINVITLEDPVEYRIAKIRQTQLNRKAGMTFASGLRSILRQDPDVVMVGEIRDAETTSIAIQAAMTGHLVLSTVHTNDASGVITRFLNMGIEPFLISSVLLTSFAQRLVRTICPNCREEYRPSEQVLKVWGMENVQDAQFSRGKGCFTCNNTGYKGRTGVFEILVNDESIQELILEQKSAREITRAVHQAGNFRSMKEDAADKIRRGITTFEEAAFAVMT
ncbi:MAG: GspE/PulE family protein [Desulfurivibrionaceae bacterium]